MQDKCHASVVSFMLIIMFKVIPCDVCQGLYRFIEYQNHSCFIMKQDFTKDKEMLVRSFSKVMTWPVLTATQKTLTDHTRPCYTIHSKWLSTKATEKIDKSKKKTHQEKINRNNCFDSCIFCGCLINTFPTTQHY